MKITKFEHACMKFENNKIGNNQKIGKKDYQKNSENKCLLQGGLSTLAFSVLFSLTEGGTGGRVKEKVTAPSREQLTSVLRWSEEQHCFLEPRLGLLLLECSSNN